MSKKKPQAQAEVRAPEKTGDVTVRFITHVAGPFGNFQAGSTGALPVEIAKTLVAAGAVVPVRGVKAESAVVPPASARESAVIESGTDRAGR